MKASTTYHMRPEVQCSNKTFSGSDMTFKTGVLPSIGFPNVVVTRPNTALSSMESPGIELLDAINTTGPGMPAIVTDRDGNVIWYYDIGPASFAEPFKLLSNGHVLINIIASNSQTLREID